MVRGEIRLAFSTVQYQGVDLCIGGRRKLDVSGKSGTPDPDDPGVFDPFKEFLS